MTEETSFVSEDNANHIPIVVKVSATPPALPDIDINDKLTLKTYEAKAAQEQLLVRAAMDRLTNAQRALNEFAKVVFDKHGLTNADAQIDMENLKFVKHPKLGDSSENTQK